MADRVRMNTLALATTALAQSPSFWHAGNDLLRSKSLDRNSYDSGDWFNRIDWSGQESTFGSGLPPPPDNEAKWPLHAAAAGRRGAEAGRRRTSRRRASGRASCCGSASPRRCSGSAARGAIQERVDVPARRAGADARRDRDGDRGSAASEADRRRLQRHAGGDDADRAVARRPPLRAAPGAGARRRRGRARRRRRGTGRSPCRRARSRCSWHAAEPCVDPWRA